MTQLRGIAWDLDGTLANTERLKYRAHLAAVETMEGEWRLTADAYLRLVGTSSRLAVTTITHTCGLADVTYEQYSEIWLGHYLKLLDTEVRLHPGVPELLSFLFSLGLRQVIVSSSSEREIMRVLELTKIADVMHGIVSADDVQHPKPHPEPYLLALDRLNLPASEVVAVEDTDAGCQSAQSAGLGVVAVKHDLNTTHRLPTQHVTDTGLLAFKRSFHARLVNAHRA